VDIRTRRLVVTAVLVALIAAVILAAVL